MCKENLAYLLITMLVYSVADVLLWYKFAQLPLKTHILPVIQTPLWDSFFHYILRDNRIAFAGLTLCCCTSWWVCGILLLTASAIASVSIKPCCVVWQAHDAVRCSARERQLVTFPQLPRQIISGMKLNSCQVFHALVMHQIIFFILVCCS